jgi:hypothetical protein
VKDNEEIILVVCRRCFGCIRIVLLFSFISMVGTSDERRRRLGHRQEPVVQLLVVIDMILKKRIDLANLGLYSSSNYCCSSCQIDCLKVWWNAGVCVGIDFFASFGRKIHQLHKFSVTWKHAVYTPNLYKYVCPSPGQKDFCVVWIDCFFFFVGLRWIFFFRTDRSHDETTSSDRVSSPASIY